MFKGWLVSVVCTAILVAFVDTLLAGSGQRHVGRLAGAMVFLLVVLRPVLGLNVVGKGHMADEWIAGFEMPEIQEDKDTGLLLRRIVTERTENYIHEKLEQMQIMAEVHIVCGEVSKDLWVPEQVCIQGDLTAAEQSELERYIEEELGIDRQRQEYRGGDPP